MTNSRSRDPEGLLEAPAYASAFRMWVLLALVLLAGLFYVAVQWFRTGEAVDTLFVGLLVGATGMLLLLYRGIVHFLIRSWIGVVAFLETQHRPLPSDILHVSLGRSVLNDRLMSCVGLGYGAALASVPYLLNLWPSDHLLAWCLSLFLFSVNFVTGVAIGSLVAFWVFAVRLGRQLRINLWQIHNPATDFILTATRRIVLAASAYAALSNSSISFSVLPVNGLVIGYFFFAGVITLLSVAVPIVPVVMNLANAKREALTDVDRQLHLAFYESPVDTDLKRTDVDFEKVKTLLELRERVEKLSLLPFRARAIATAATVLVLSSIPVVLEVLLNRVFR